MADMPAYQPEKRLPAGNDDSLRAGRGVYSQRADASADSGADSQRADPGDDFADELSGNLYPSRNFASPGGLYGVAHKQLFGLAEGGKAELVRNIGNIVAMVREIAGQVEGFGVEPFAGYARQASGVVGDIHDSLASKSVQELVEDGRDIVRHQPEIAVAAAVITGFIVARLVKARS